MGGSADNIKKYRLPVGEFLHNMLQNQKAIISSMAVNEDGVLVSGADNGSLWCVPALLWHGGLGLRVCQLHGSQWGRRACFQCRQRLASVSFLTESIC